MGENTRENGIQENSMGKENILMDIS